MALPGGAMPFGHLALVCSNRFLIATSVTRMQMSAPISVRRSPLLTSLIDVCVWQCIASGNPIPQVVWHIYDNLPIPDHIARYRIGDYVTRDSLLVSYVNISSVLPEGELCPLILDPPDLCDRVY